MLFGWPRWLERHFGKPPRSRRAKQPRRTILSLEPLEDRRLMATYSVTVKDDAGAGSLREAIVLANKNLGKDTIKFNIPGGAQTITLASPLPAIEDSVIIDATNQPVTLDGAKLKGKPNGLVLTNGVRAGVNINANNSQVLGLTIQNFTGDGILVSGVTGCTIGGGQPNQSNTIIKNLNGIHVTQGATGTIIIGNFIGTNSLSAPKLGNTNDGVLLDTDSSRNWVGQPNAKLNIISGNGGSGVEIANSQSNTVIRNYIGTSVGGAAALGNLKNGVYVHGYSEKTTIGGVVDLMANVQTAPANLISGNQGDNVRIEKIQENTHETKVLGNFIGTDVTGTKPLRGGGNSSGVHVIESDEITIGGVAAGGGLVAGARNIISGNSLVGILVEKSDKTKIIGNYVGTDKTGKAAISNLTGIEVRDSPNTSIGGIVAAPRGIIAQPANLISGNGVRGIYIASGSAGTKVQGNFIGTDVSGELPLGNKRQGILVTHATNITIGGPLAGSRNVISANGVNPQRDLRGVGVSVIGESSRVLIENNNIGWGKDFGEKDIKLGNGSYGVQIGETDGVNTIKGRNRIDNNNNMAVQIKDDSKKVKISGANLIGGDLAIDTGTTNGMPVLTSAAVSGQTTLVSGSLSSLPNSTFLLEFFGNDAAAPSGYGPGEQFLGNTTVTTNSGGNATYSVTLNAVYGLYVSATSTGTGTDGNTSEYSQDLAITGGSSTLPPPPTVTALDVASGPTSGGTTVNVTGTNFQIVTEVDVGSTSADFTRNSSTSLTITVPPENAGTAAVPGGRAKRPASEQQISRRGCRAGRIALSLSLV